jgi:hypothetical protein
MPNANGTSPANRLLRMAGRDATALQVLAQVHQMQPYALQTLATAVTANQDYTQIEPALSLEGEAADGGASSPPVGVGYAGLTPVQRANFLRWAADPVNAAPAAFQQLYLAHVEVALLEGGAQAKLARQELDRLQRAPAWQAHEALARTVFLACWLAQDGPGLIDWIADANSPLALLGIGLGCQALLGEPLHPDQIAMLLTRWQLTTSALPASVLALRLHSLATNLGAEPLAYALAELGEGATQPRPWRCYHRDLRIALPQPDVRRTLMPLLAEIVAVNDDVTTIRSIPEQPIKLAEDATITDLGWHVILEFGQSRSDLFHFALTLAQRLPSFAQILDENRKLVYRVVFKKSEMRNFWRLWDYVQSWSTTRIYLNGQELEKWQVYPYSQYLR